MKNRQLHFSDVDPEWPHYSDDVNKLCIEVYEKIYKLWKEYDIVLYQKVKK